MQIGQVIKVSLPGESPWAECVAIHDDGTWNGRIVNQLFHEMSEIAQARFTKGAFSTVAKLPQLHSFKQGEVVRFEESDGRWTPLTDSP